MDPQSDQSDRLLAPADVRAILGHIHLETVRRLMRSGAIRSIDIGTGARSHWRTTREALDAWLASPVMMTPATRSAPTSPAPTPLTHGSYRDWVKTYPT